ncbi:MAG: hypothetical protein ACYTG6_06375 [Planctomycetota bacterium]|jgi:hypothetical protein
MRRWSQATLLLLVALTAWLAVPRAAADAGDDTLQSWLKRSDVVVDATLRSIDGPEYGEAGVANYSAVLDVHAYAKGTLPPPPEEALVPGEEPRPRVAIVRFEMEEADRLPYLKAGARVVLFLKTMSAGTFPSHQTCDVWFGVQPHGPWLVRRLGELAGREDAPR